MRVWLACVIVLLSVGSVSAQVTGRVYGSVVDPTGAAVVEAKVSVSLPESNTPALTTVTTKDGLFTFTAVRPDLYDLSVEAPGFEPYVIRGLDIDPARAITLPPIQLAREAITITVDVTAGAPTVQTGNAELATTITTGQIRRLPVLDRHALSLIATQAGVNNVGGVTSINGQRTSHSNVTLDGINIQDNYIRENSLGYTPNLIALDQIAAFTLTTSNANASMGGGASHVTFVPPSGGNQFHGSLYFYNRNNALAANDWFNNKDGIERPAFNQHQIGGKIGGPIIRDKTFFYANYEAFRFGVDVQSNLVVLTNDARNGVFTYEDQSGQVRKVNLLQATGVSADPTMQQLLARIPGPDQINNFRAGDSRESLLRNTAGYSFVRKGHHNRDNVTLKLDHTMSPANVFSGTFLWNLQDVTRSDLSKDFSRTPKVRNDDKRKLLSLAWRWNARSHFTNEVRGGFNLAPLTFASSEDFGDRIIAGMLYSNPVNLFRTEKRNTDTYSLMDNASYSRGKHTIQFGFDSQLIRLKTLNEAGITPTYTLGNTSLVTGLNASQLPGISANDFVTANSLLASLAGFVTTYSQTFNITDRTSGFVAGTPTLRNYRWDVYSFYGQDSWKVAPRLTLNFGLRYELPGVLDERDGLALLPRVQNNDVVATMLSNATLDFAGNSAGRPFYKKDTNNFAPNFGFAWDVFGDARTSVRAGYSVSYVNDETIGAILNNVNFNEGLTAVSSRAVTARVSALPAIPVPTFKVPRTFEENFRLNAFTAFGMPNPELKTPYVQQWNAAIQREVKGTVIELRYVGNHGVKMYRGFDLNSEVTVENGFLDDFKRAMSNAALARAAFGVYDPEFNPNVSGSQRLTVFPQLIGGGLLSNPLVRNQIQLGQAGELAFLYFFNGLAGPVQFYRNPVSLASLVLNNESNTSYNALQIDVLRRFHRGLQFQANYTYGKVLSDSNGTAYHRFEEIRDPKNAKIDRARTSFDVTHAIKANAVYDLPFSHGNKFINGLVSGWAASGIMRWQSGNPFSILSRRATLLRAFRSSQNTASSNLDKDQLDELLKFRMTANGPFIVAASAIGPDGRAVSTDTTPPFSGQAFFNPAPGEIGGLQRRWFSGPWNFDLNMALLKNISIREGQSLELRMEALNVLNHPTWFVPDQDINTTTFGRVEAANSSRRIQLSLHYHF
jgi:hypothetical protein